jgi:hypothetical protein
MSDIRFCLLMIVRDEAKIIHRAFDSVKNIIDSYYIHDTGSLDGTQDIIRSYWAEKNIPGYVVEKPWVNFGHNKNELIQCAQAHTDKNISGTMYYIWLDADEVFLTDPSNPESYLTKENAITLFNDLELLKDDDIFLFLTTFGGKTYYRWNACRNNQPYRWVQPVHECFFGTVHNSVAYINTVHLLARKEGNSARNPNRIHNDIQMFLEYLTENPNDPRALFYLARTYESVDIEKAIQYYKQRLAVNAGWCEEKYMSYLHLGRHLPDINDKIRYLTEGTLLNPNRLECYYELMMIYYSKKDHLRAASYGLMAPENRIQNRFHLFVMSDIYNYLFDLNFGVSCYYAGLFEKGKEAILRALSYPKLPEHTKKLLNTNLEYFNRKMTIQTVPLRHIEPPRQELIVIENFYSDPHKVREEALRAEYTVKGRYPGTRSKPYIYDGIKEKFESIIGRKISFWDNSYNGSFQWVTEDMKSWIHRDKTDWSVVVYLTPNAPTDGGTKTFLHKELGLSSTEDPVVDERLNKDAYNEDAWHLVDRVGNLFNRCVMFRGKRSHISDRYFGTNMETARLFQTFFFNDT